MRIYIIGPTGSGKTTLSKALAKKHKINRYELDCIVYDDEDNHRKRTDEEISIIFTKILKKKSWIIEDVGRDKFNKGLEKCDKIYYIKLGKLEVYKRVIKRWVKQRCKKEEYNYPPTFEQLFDMLKITYGYFKKEKLKLDKIKKFENKLVYLSKQDLNNLEI